MDARSLSIASEILIAAMEDVQAKKVIDLARRLKPGLTAEDIRNPHDFPDLDDTDWHFEDGQLAGIQAVRFAVTALSRELFDDEGRYPSSSPEGPSLDTLPSSAREHEEEGGSANEGAEEEG